MAEKLADIGVQAKIYFEQRKNAEIEDARRQATISRYENELYNAIPQRVIEKSTQIGQLLADKGLHPEEKQQVKENGPKRIQEINARGTVISMYIAHNLTELGRFEQATEAATQHFLEHEAEYYDLAVIEAHRAGIQLKLEQPLVIGNA